MQNTRRSSDNGRQFVCCQETGILLVTRDFNTDSEFLWRTCTIISWRWNQLISAHDDYQNLNVNTAQLSALLVACLMHLVQFSSTVRTHSIGMHINLFGLCQRTVRLFNRAQLHAVFYPSCTHKSIYLCRNLNTRLIWPTLLPPTRCTASVVCCARHPFTSNMTLWHRHPLDRKQTPIEKSRLCVIAVVPNWK